MQESRLRQETSVVNRKSLVEFWSPPVPVDCFTVYCKDSFFFQECLGKWLRLSLNMSQDGLSVPEESHFFDEMQSPFWD